MQQKLKKYENNWLDIKRGYPMQNKSLKSIINKKFEKNAAIGLILALE